MRGLLDPKMDFVFKNIFGNENNPKILISFLNAVLKPENLITGVEIKDTDLNNDNIADRYSKIDIKAMTSNEEINIMLRLESELNTIEEILYNYSSFCLEQLSDGEDDNTLKRAVCINILNFKYLKTKGFHSVYRMKEIQTNEELTDVEEIHFIEIPKLEDSSDKKEDMLVAWIEFLKNPESEKVRSFEMNIDEIRVAKDELVKMSNDDAQRELYEVRSNALRDKISALNAAKQKGETNSKLKIAKALLDVLDVETIAEKVGLSVEKVKSLKEYKDI